MLTYTTRNDCRVCGSTDLKTLIALDEIYINDFPENPEDHRGKAPMTLVECQQCSLVQMEESVSEEIYNDYWYKSALNQKIVNNLEDIVTKATQMVGTRDNSIVVDIGANDGTLLSFYPDNVTTVGIDPAKTITDELNAVANVVINDFFDADAFDEAFLGKKARIITAIAMFYDLDDPHKFVGDIKRILDNEGVFIAQFMGLPQMAAINDVGNICHEHLLFYTMDSLKQLFAAHDLKIVQVHENDINGGSWQIWVRHADIPDAETDYVSPSVDAQAFVDSLYENQGDLIEFLEQCKTDGKKVYIYGASTKGNTIAQFYGLNSDLIAGAAEIHPDKIGRYMVGTGIPIVHEDDARKDADYFLVMPFGFRDVFVKKETSVDLVFCTPKFEIVKTSI